MPAEALRFPISPERFANRIGRDLMKTALLGSMFALSVAVSGCATNDRYDDRYRDNDNLESAATGAAIGGAAGAAAGAVIDGVSPVEGAIGGAIVGGAVVAVTAKDDRRWYRDDRGYCYYIDRRGDRRYDYDRRRC